MTPKSFRRWLKTELSKRGVRVEFIKRMMGHDINVEGTSYEGTFDDPDEYFKIYAFCFYVPHVVEWYILQSKTSNL